MLCICIQWRNKKLITHNYNSLNFFIYPNFSVPLSSFLAGQRRRVHQFASLHCLWLPFHGNLMKRWKERCLEKLRGDIIEKNLKNKRGLSCARLSQQSTSFLGPMELFFGLNCSLLYCCIVELLNCWIVELLIC